MKLASGVAHELGTPLTGHTDDDTRVAPRQRGRAAFVVAQVALATETRPSLSPSAVILTS